MLLRPEARFDLAVRLRREGAPVGEVFAFVSGLYFRGKLAYAAAFGPSRVITPDLGLLDPDELIQAEDVARFGAIDIARGSADFLEPFRRDVAGLVHDGPVVLLGSLATGKYLDVLVPAFGDRLYAPADFPGMGDMKRGSVLLKAARAGQELPYAQITRGRRSV
jgi:hypothetical protein